MNCSSTAHSNFEAPSVHAPKAEPGRFLRSILKLRGQKTSLKRASGHTRLGAPFENQKREAQVDFEIFGIARIIAIPSPWRPNGICSSKVVIDINAKLVERPRLYFQIVF